MNLHILFLTALPICLGQFSIQGPSDGNRVAQGLKYSEDKGIEYTDQSASLGSGDFAIQGASDGNSQFTIQGATDGHSNFQIQGPQDGGAAQFHIQGGPAAGANAQFNIQGATDGHSQSIIQGPYDPNQQSGRALQYKDPSGLRVNWRSYQHTRQPQPQPQLQQQLQAEPQQYVQPSPQRAIPQRTGRQRVRQPQHQAQVQPTQPVQQAQIQQPNYTPYENAPPSIKQILQFQAQIPYINVIPEHLRYDALAAQQAQAQLVQAHYQKEQAKPPQEGQYRAASKQPRERSRQKRQAPQQQQTQQPNLGQYRRIAQPPVEALPQYSTNLPSGIQQILKYQAQIPYNIIANQINYRPDKPYVPQPVNPEQYQEQPREATYQPTQQAYQPQQATYQPQQATYQPQQATYQPQQAAYQPQQSAAYQPQQAAYQAQQASYQSRQSQEPQSQYPQSPLQQYQGQPLYPQGQPAYHQGQAYNQGQGVRPVTENQY